MLSNTEWNWRAGEGVEHPGATQAPPSSLAPEMAVLGDVGGASGSFREAAHIMHAASEPRFDHLWHSI